MHYFISFRYFIPLFIVSQYKYYLRLSFISLFNIDLNCIFYMFINMLLEVKRMSLLLLYTSSLMQCFVTLMVQLQG